MLVRHGLEEIVDCLFPALFALHLEELVVAKEHRKLLDVRLLSLRGFFL